MSSGGVYRDDKLCGKAEGGRDPGWGGARRRRLKEGAVKSERGRDEDELGGAMGCVASIANATLKVCVACPLRPRLLFGTYGC